MFRTNTFRCVRSTVFPLVALTALSACGGGGGGGGAGGGSSSTSSTSSTTGTVVPTYAYVANQGDGTVSQYTVGAAGALTKITTAVTSDPVAGKTSGPQSVAVDHAGHYAYVANKDVSTISQFAVGTNGALTALTPATVTETVATNPYPYAIAIDPTDSHLYVANYGAASVSEFTIGTGGTLTYVGDTPAGTNPYAIAIDPTGKYLIVANSDQASTTTGATISAYTIGSDGSLTQMAGSPISTDAQPEAIAFDPVAPYVYVVNYWVDAITQYTWDSTNNTLTVSTSTPPSTNPTYTNAKLPAGADTTDGAGPDSIAIDPQGRYLYVTTYDGYSVLEYTIGSGGALTYVSSNLTTLGSGVGPSSVAMDPSGQYLYVTDSKSTAGVAGVYQFAIGAGGALRSMAAPTVDSGLGPEFITTAH